MSAPERTVDVVLAELAEMTTDDLRALLKAIHVEIEDLLA